MFLNKVFYTYSSEFIVVSTACDADSTASNQNTKAAPLSNCTLEGEFWERHDAVG